MRVPAVITCVRQPLTRSHRSHGYTDELHPQHDNYRNNHTTPQHYNCNYRITHTLYYHNYNNGYYNKRMDA